MTEDNYAFRVKTLNEEQLQFLKIVWLHLLKFWGIKVDERPLLNDSGCSGRKRATSLAAHELKTNRPRSRSTIFKIHSSVEENEGEGISDFELHEALKNSNPDDTREEFWNMIRADFPDSLLLRFIRARKWDLNKSMTMISNTLDWRVNDSKVDKIIYEGERAAYDGTMPGFYKNLELQKAVICGKDKEGRPIVCVRPKLHHSKDQSLEEMQRYSLLIIEQARLFLKDPVDTATVIFDLSGFSMSNMDYAPVQFLISCFEAHYPECLGKLYIHKAPWIFSPIWKIIRKWLDPVVASKIVFTKSSNDLKEFIACDQLPEYLEGSNPINLDTYQEIAADHDNQMEDVDTKNRLLSERELIIKQFVDTTIKWIESSNATESQNLLYSRIALGRQLTANYCELDPYIRSRSRYDIDGSLVV
ncbi:uncharacterized protein GVI51_D00847 [Nakaseomyces glabratus]|uniref:CRAL-TRIO domain-containing protein n=1 Tax=Candida glabrata (strain ATCC 2001 / BCRC 20586 / JCM 3761 / NBRC 0622 / NRRL Y-65 / CBS 138) TaxID=284593 RepID=Q6FWD9_CANGA|nr:uncharacterized protein CAGL0D00946g [Nakaseomyces glabratus]KAH7590803.1 CRAL/TRIO, N-terminal domain [Nakaseomyces glabratus]KAH7596539.1 CRAL/TRIO, N-terminal domain [Nakaseomyces glabratus]KAH7608188.1 CRAL/TRIO, N-terminal domain [Nakaseomyces glabratus]KAH7608305.1 CRAL/TRIO, N-terminal domain [Nakaseomyces glabratus]KAI8389561.1 CRAL/TRIO, N-terminal domain [Nakaseomyces glabratus]|eukprot:XP_445455.1 uncharacterized protein CAGL0D00946g [[Candida] glabrata]